MRTWYLSFLFLFTLLQGDPMSAKTTGNIIKVGLVDFPENIDTSSIKSANEYRISYNLVSSLFYLGSNDRYYSYLLTDWYADHEKKTLSLTLKKNLKFSNGDPLTADDVIFSLKRQIVRGSAHAKLSKKIVGADDVSSMSDNVDGIQRIDKYNLKIKFNSFSDIVFYIFTMPETGIISPKQVNKKLDIVDWSFSSGPYYVQNETKGKMILSPNQYHSLIKTSMKFELIKYKNERDVAKDLVLGKIYYTFLKLFSDPSIYSSLDSADNISMSEGKITAVQEIALNIKNSPFNDIKTRQAIYKKIQLEDFRPLKNDKYFVKADQYFFPHHQGRLSQSQITSIMSKFPETITKRSENRKLKYFASESLLPKRAQTYFVNFLKELGVKIELDEFQGYKHLGENWKDVAFLPSQMFMNDKEVQQSIEYSVNLGWVFDKNQNKIKELNDKLFGTSSRDEKSKLVNQIAGLILEDATVIPLYFIVSHDFINKKLQLIQDFGYFDTPKLWNFRYTEKI